MGGYLCYLPSAIRQVNFAVKREELRNKLTDILSAAMSGGINFTQAERSIWDLFNPGLPPAEGAEEILANLEAYYDFKFHWIEKDRIIRAMTEFATLHAQKIADKKYADTEADGYVFCGKCGKMKEI